MDPGFWHDRWEQNRIGFHQNEVNSFLAKHYDKLSLKKGSKIFIPLCGKTLDISWLLSKGYAITGVELSNIAIEQLFKELELEPKITSIGEFKKYSSKNIDIFEGDIFNLTQNILGPVNAVYDRAALVALPQKSRKRYTKHLMEITNHSPQFLITYEYDQQLMEGPPFSVSPEEIHKLYSQNYILKLIETFNVSEKLKGKLKAKEYVWLLENK